MPTLQPLRMDEDLKREFDAARLKHIMFKARLRSYLYGSGDGPRPVRDPDECPLGQWIRDVALVRFGHLPETLELDVLHRRIHLEADHLIDLHRAGRVDEAQRGLRLTNPLTEEVLRLLSTLERKLRTGAH